MKGWLSVWTFGETGTCQNNLISLGGYWPAGCDSAAVLPAGVAAAAAAVVVAKEAAVFLQRAGRSVHLERSGSPD